MRIGQCVWGEVFAVCRAALCFLAIATVCTGAAPAQPRPDGIVQPGADGIARPGHADPQSLEAEVRREAAERGNAGDAAFWEKALAPLVGVVIGALISILAAWRFNLQARRVEYAIRNRREIYGPLYEETLALCQTLKEYPFPWRIYAEPVFGADLTESYGHFRYWSKLKQDQRALRVPRDIRERLNELDDLIRRYNELRPACNAVIGAAVEQALSQHGLTARVANLGEISADHVLAARSRAPEAFSDACFGEAPPPQVDEIYGSACGAVAEEPVVTQTRELATDLARSVDGIEATLRGKIELILRRYEGRLPEI